MVGTKALSRVLDDRDVSVTRSDGVDLVHVGRLAVEMTGDGLGLRRDGGFNFARVNVTSVGYDTDEDRHGTEAGR